MAESSIREAKRVVGMAKGLAGLAESTRAAEKAVAAASFDLKL